MRSLRWRPSAPIASLNYLSAADAAKPFFKNCITWSITCDQSCRVITSNLNANWFDSHWFGQHLPTESRVIGRSSANAPLFDEAARSGRISRIRWIRRIRRIRRSKQSRCWIPAATGRSEGIQCGSERCAGGADDAHHVHAGVDHHPDAVAGRFHLVPKRQGPDDHFHQEATSRHRLHHRHIDAAIAAYGAGARETGGSSGSAGAGGRPPAPTVFPGRFHSAFIFSSNSAAW